MAMSGPDSNFIVPKYFRVEKTITSRYCQDIQPTHPVSQSGAAIQEFTHALRKFNIAKV